MKKSFEGYKFISLLSKEGNQNSISDAGVACLCVHTAIHGAYLNVIINIKDLDDDTDKAEKAKARNIPIMTKQQFIETYNL